MHTLLESYLQLEIKKEYIKLDPKFCIKELKVHLSDEDTFFISCEYTDTTLTKTIPMPRNQPINELIFYTISVLDNWEFE